MARILLIGSAVVDIINVVAGYPPEDSETRASEQRIVRGGNAANSAVVLRQFGHQCAFGGILSNAPQSRMIIEDLNHCGIDTSPCQVVNGGTAPTSYVTLNRLNGSRTIVHYRGLREFRYDDFAGTALDRYDWIHFEGRNIPETLRMLERTRRDSGDTPVSLEIEKPRPGDEQRLLALPDLVTFSRSYALDRGFDNAPAFLRQMRHLASGACLVCPWGEAGAWALDANEQMVFAPASPVQAPVDTLGAGDVFNAALIHGLLNRTRLIETLTGACRLAARKCSRIGFDGLGRTVVELGTEGPGSTSR